MIETRPPTKTRFHQFDEPKPDHIHIYICVHPRAESFDPRHMWDMLDGMQKEKTRAE